MIETLMFHRVLPKSKIDFNDAYFIRGTLISQERLEKVILEYLKNDYSFKTISNLDNDSSINQVALTFDDGYTDNYLFVKPILEKYNIKATFYPIIGYCKERKIAPLDYYYHYVNENIAKDKKGDWIIGKQKKTFLNYSITQQKEFIKTLSNHTNSKNRVSYMSIQQLQDLDSLNHEIGGHSVYHDIYTKLSENEIIEDIRETKQMLSNIGIEIESYAYTDGQYNSTIIEILKNENIKYACAIKSNKLTDYGSFELERKFITENEII
ncbi:polysaccharide deacetylase family protein [Tenacibaculum finnmarkense genomovar ulcerans]|uniref:polysaccharide deacetylase family protein n=1 Tax=Tenacibaculum finnmarkense TaxID=2781243 RepID=UPI00187BA72C|nr:polysaccharide deacetylase family protein [Tenacibaculum finnmarkense]MBE7688826.1 polysaccharide deacetylase family protein [Tenacibaculum finnmarkense genomovar ulcerans]